MNQKTKKPMHIDYTAELQILPNFRPVELVQKSCTSSHTVFKLKLVNGDFYRDPYINLKHTEFSHFLNKIIASMAEQAELYSGEDKAQVLNIFKDKI